MKKMEEGVVGWGGGKDGIQRGHFILNPDTLCLSKLLGGRGGGVYTMCVQFGVVLRATLLSLSPITVALRDRRRLHALCVFSTTCTVVQEPLWRWAM